MAVLLPSGDGREDGRTAIFRNVVVLYFYKFFIVLYIFIFYILSTTMDKFQKTIGSQCYMFSMLYTIVRTL